MFRMHRNIGRVATEMHPHQPCYVVNGRRDKFRHSDQHEGDMHE